MSNTVVEQGGAIVYRRDHHGIRILLVRAKKNPVDWIFPKGHIEAGETAAETAVREAEEEAGVTGRVVAPVSPAITFDAGDRRIRVHYFLVEFTGEVSPTESREQAWLVPSEALARLTYATSRALLERALEMMRDG